MTTNTVSPTAAKLEDVIRASWLPLVVIVLAQLQMGFNINALPVSIGPIAEDLNAPATAIGTALVVYSLFVAAFVMLGAKFGKLFGERLVFQLSVVAHGISMALMAIAIRREHDGHGAGHRRRRRLPRWCPRWSVLIASNYRDRQQAQALGILASVPAICERGGVRRRRLHRHRR